MEEEIINRKTKETEESNVEVRNEQLGKGKGKNKRKRNRIKNATMLRRVTCS